LILVYFNKNVRLNSLPYSPNPVQRKHKNSLSNLADKAEKFMNIKQIRYVQFSILWLCIFSSMAASSAESFLDLDVNVAILEKAKANKAITDHEKLFVYRCKMMKKYLGFPDTPTGKATKYSCDVPAVGIALYAGKDLGKHPPEKIAQYFIDELAKHNVKAKAFIKHDHEYGSSMAFYINGESWVAMPLDPLEATKKIELLATETKLILLTKGRIKKWPESVSPQ